MASAVTSTRLVSGSGSGGGGGGVPAMAMAEPSLRMRVHPVAGSATTVRSRAERKESFRMGSLLRDQSEGLFGVIARARTRNYGTVRGGKQRGGGDRALRFVQPRNRAHVDYEAFWPITRTGSPIRMR